MLNGRPRVLALDVDFMLKWNLIKQKVDVNEMITNELIDEIKAFDAGRITSEASEYKPAR